ncbi:MAG TPA: gluconokinase [Propionicimonas sp.]|nr:gluconokinase [Propionicimonas sp.]HRA07087.1 gluconokinase [Propionicimonas sp.]
MTNTHLVIMGVAGCGKSSVARALHEQLGWTVAEGDEFHPASNIAKMSSGTPLNDDDRWPWLDSIAAWTASQDSSGTSTIVTCSALRRSYRDRLRSAPGRTVFLHLVGSTELLAERLAGRTDHFMPASLLPSQLATLEPLESDEVGVALDIDRPVEEIAQSAIGQLKLNPSQLPTTES